MRSSKSSIALSKGEPDAACARLSSAIHLIFLRSQREDVKRLQCCLSKVVGYQVCLIMLVLQMQHDRPVVSKCYLPSDQRISCPL